jgi:hypothetical protein
MFVTMSKDILSRENRAIGDFTTRQVVFGGIGLALALFVGFKGAVNFSTQNRIYLAMAAALPFFALGFLKIYGEPIEKILPIIIRDNFLNPVKRLYHAENACIAEFEKENGVEKGKEKGKNKDIVDKKHPVKASKDPMLIAIK